VKRLALIAAKHDLNFCIDAEEADRLVLSLKLLDRLAREPELGAWTGLGLAVQAYQKRGPYVIAQLSALARSSGRRLMVRLVKGAYWDSEIKRAQVAGRPDYPVYTTKSATDLSYLVCAEALIEASPHLYGQFATHNAHTLAAVKALADRRGVRVEFQRLHGMGEALYEAANRRYNGVSCAPMRRGRARGPAALPGAAAAGERGQHLLRSRPAGRARAGGEGGAGPHRPGAGPARAAPAHPPAGGHLW
jgi:RHH-type proline utilization regulon transcriptional repressor/proline dehydrogenase/delta 1-pyrroline-5-carboxylate dehydrogenase